MRSSGWRGTGTVTVPSSVRFCIATWLPRWRTSTKPCLERMAQTSRPESLRSLPNVDLQRGDVHLRLQALDHLRGVGRLEEEIYGLL
jgi:hypothetical protein